MPTATLQDALRYLMIGVAIFVHYYFWDQEGLSNLITTLGATGIVLSCLAIGSLTYILYRGLIYNALITLIQDLFRISRKDNYRTYLKQLCNLSRSDDSRQLYVYIKDKHLSKRFDNFTAAFSGIHYAYMVGIASLTFGSLSIICGKTQLIFPYFMSCAAILVGTFFAHRRLETDEYLVLRSVSEEKIKEAKRELFGE